MSTMPGDSLISAAFVTYAGYFDQSMREQLFNAWTVHLQQANIRFRQDLARVEYLSSVDERMQWQANSLPVDDLCTENAIMLKVMFFLLILYRISMLLFNLNIQICMDYEVFLASDIFIPEGVTAPRTTHCLLLESRSLTITNDKALRQCSPVGLHPNQDRHNGW